MASSPRSTRVLRLVPKPASTLVDGHTLLCLAEDLRERASIPRQFYEPHLWANQLGFEVMLVPDANEMARVERHAPRTLGYVWHHERRERGIRLYCGVSRVALQIECIPHTGLDVWRLALELALPAAMLSKDVEYLAGRQPDCPVAVIAARIQSADLYRR